MEGKQLVKGILDLPEQQGISDSRGTHFSSQATRQVFNFCKI